MTQYAQVHDIRDRLQAVRTPQEWFTQAGRQVTVFRAPGDGPLSMFSYALSLGCGVTEWGASLDSVLDDLAGPVSAPWAPHPVDAEVMWVDPMFGQEQYTTPAGAVAYRPFPTCSEHAAIDTGWRTSECRHCGAPMELRNMQWEVARRVRAD